MDKERVNMIEIIKRICELTHLSFIELLFVVFVLIAFVPMFIDAVKEMKHGKRTAM